MYRKTIEILVPDPSNDFSYLTKEIIESLEKEKATIYPITLGVDQCYIIRGEKTIMIDAGSPKQAKSFRKAVERLSIKPEDIKLIVLTHGHWDHIGTAKEIKDLTGGKLALHQKEKDWLEKSLKPLPPGVTAWGKTFGKILALFMPLIHISATDVDIVLGDGEFPLSEYGIPGKILYTPGHSMGSVSIVYCSIRGILSWET